LCAILFLADRLLHGKTPFFQGAYQKRSASTSFA
jgi:hypothetical protein